MLFRSAACLRQRRAEVEVAGLVARGVGVGDVAGQHALALGQQVQGLAVGVERGGEEAHGGVPVARGELDYLRMGVGREPSAEYQTATLELSVPVVTTVVVLIAYLNRL